KRFRIVVRWRRIAISDSTARNPVPLLFVGIRPWISYPNMRRKRTTAAFGIVLIIKVVFGSKAFLRVLGVLVQRYRRTVLKSSDNHTACPLAVLFTEFERLRQGFLPGLECSDILLKFAEDEICAGRRSIPVRVLH